METTRFNLLRRNKFYLFWCRFFVNLNALNAVVQLFYIHRGLSIPQIFYLGVAWSLATLIFDIPSSYLADKWGKKNTMVLGVVINVLANGYLFFAQGFIPLLIDTFIMSASLSFFAGIEDAFLYETLKEMKQEGGVLKTSGKYLVAARLATMLAPLIGVLIAKDLTSTQFNILVLINFLSSCIAVLFAVSLVEPKKQIEELSSKIHIFKDGLKLFWNTESLRVMALNKTLIFVASFIFWRFYQDALHNMGVSVLMLGIIYPLFNILAILVFSNTEKISKTFNHWTIFELPSWIMFAASLAFLVTDYKWIAYVASIFIIAIATMRDPFFIQQVQWKIKSHNRSTTTSIFGIFKSALDIPLLLLSGFIASFGGKWVVVVPLLISGVVIVFLKIKKEYILEAYNGNEK